VKYTTFILLKTIEYLWHGSDLKNLKTILSQGLITSGKVRQGRYLKESDTLRSIHGIYLTSDKNTALNYSNGLMILIKASYDQENFALDEDLINNIILPKLKRTFNNDNKLLDENPVFDEFINIVKQYCDVSANTLAMSLSSEDVYNLFILLSNNYLSELSGNDLKEYRTLMSRITKVLGRYIKHSNMDFNKFGYNKNITYKGATRIVSIWARTSERLYDGYKYVQIYGEHKYNKMFYVKNVTEVVENFHGLKDYYLYEKAITNNDDGELYWELVNKGKIRR